MGSADKDVTIPMAANVIAVHGIPVSESSTDSGTAFRAQPTTRCRKCGFAFGGVLLLVVAVVGAMYINVLNSLPEFANAAGESTIDVSSACLCSLHVSHLWWRPVFLQQNSDEQ